ncbi:MAG TPA: hypothetical protein VGG39_32555 [Polyangiaceae bacterium]|jgi:hypothetical protein
MPRSILALVTLALALPIAACAQSSQSPVVTAPSATEPTAGTAAQPGPATPPPSSAVSAMPPATLAADTPPATGTTPSSTAAPSIASTAGASSPAASSTVPAQYRACAADADCVAVARAACCNHGWKEAVAASQKDAYARDFACKAARRPICPMFMVHDARVAKCDVQQKLCTMVEP